MERPEILQGVLVADWFKPSFGPVEATTSRFLLPLCGVPLLEILLHETIGGGFSPPAVAKLHRHARSAASGADRTRYTTRRKVFSFKSHHSQRISLGIVKADSRGILHSFGRMANSLSRA